MSEPYEITNDRQAEWSMGQIRAARAEVAKYERYYQEQLERIRAECRSTEEYHTAMLERYFATVPHRCTKTQESYRLPSGKLVRAKQQPAFIRDEEALLPYLRQNAPQLILRTESVDWQGLKKRVAVQGETAVDAQTGEVIPGITVEQRPDKFMARLTNEKEESEA